MSAVLGTKHHHVFSVACSDERSVNQTGTQVLSRPAISWDHDEISIRAAMLAALAVLAVLSGMAVLAVLIETMTG